MLKNYTRNIMPPLSSKANKSPKISLLLKENNEKNNIESIPSEKYTPINSGKILYKNNLYLMRKIPNSSRQNKSIGNYYNFLNKLNAYRNIYSGRITSLNRNLSDIHLLIKDKKTKNIKNNLMFNSMSSNDYLDDFKRYKKLNLLSIKKHRNNSSEELFSISKKMKSLMRSEEMNQLSTNFSKIVSAKENNSIITSLKNIKNNNSDYTTTTNKSEINNSKLPEIQSNSSKINDINEYKNFSKNINLSPKLPSLKINKDFNISSDGSNIENEKIMEEREEKKEESFLTSLNTDKMKFKINKLFIENNRRKKLAEFEEKILKIKIYQNYQKEALEKILQGEKFNVQERIDHIIKMYKLYESIYEEYVNDLSRYINFLVLISGELDIELRAIRKQKKDLLYNIEILVDKLITMQIKLEYSIKTRNFLFYVKNREKKIIELDEDFVIRVAKRRTFADKLLSIFGKNRDSIAIKYLKRLIPLEKLMSMVKARIHRTSRINRIVRRNSLKQSKTIKSEKPSDVLTPPPPGKKIFDSPEEFIKILNNIKYNNIILLKDYELAQIKKNEMLNELDKDIAYYERFEKSEKNKYLKNNHISLEEEKKKYKINSQKHEYINKLLENKEDDYSLKLGLKINFFSSFNDVYEYNMVKYNKLRIKYKYAGLLLLEKLINNIKVILSMNENSNIFNKDDINHYLPYGLLNQIIQIKRDYFNEDNQYLIREYTIKLLKLYEFFGKFIMNKNEISKINEPKLYMKIRDKVITQRKISNSKNIRKIVEEKNEVSSKKLLEKWNKKIILETRKIDKFSSHDIINKSIILKNKDEKNENKNDEFENYNLLVNDAS